MQTLKVEDIYYSKYRIFLTMLYDYVSIIYSHGYNASFDVMHSPNDVFNKIISFSLQKDPKNNSTIINDVVQYLFIIIVSLVTVLHR